MRTYTIIAITILFLMLVGGAVFMNRNFLLSKIVKTSASKKVSVTQTLSPTISEEQIPKSLQVLFGSATLEHNGNKVTVASGSAQPIVMHDIVTTNEDSIAVLNYDKGTVLRLAPEAKIEVTDTSKHDTVSQLLGSIFVRFKKIIGIREGFSVKTPNTVATVRGTGFAVYLYNPQYTKIAVTEHTVQVALNSSNSATLNASPSAVTEGSQADVTKGVEISKYDLTPFEKLWIDFNNEANFALDSGTTDTFFATASAQFVRKYKLTEITPTPTKPPLTSFTSMPGEGYNKGVVNTPNGTFVLSCIGGQKGSTKVVTDSANDDDCKNDCPVKSLSDFVQGNNGFAGMNGMYFCPADYPSCSDKKNSFDTLFFNSRLKKYINSDNNVYSTIPFLVILSDGTPRFVTHTQEWGRDTSIQAGIAGNPMLVQGGNSVVNVDALDTKQKTVKSNRGAFVESGNLIYLCITEVATVQDSASVYSTLHADNAMNIDGGGSSALYSNGSYIYGPGRAIPNAIIFSH